MCGIAGLFRLQGTPSSEDHAGVRQMMRAQKHRGPDQEGFHYRGPVLLSHNRLSIIDLSAQGAQPMTNETGDIHVVFNGEIYNYTDLRRELLDLGHRFVSQTDTEVLVHGYEAWGMEELLKRTRGMFAFALSDLSNRFSTPRLFLARDRLGIKPLYYAQSPERLLFSSEVRTLIQSGFVSSRLDSSALVGFLQMGSIPGPKTVYQQIQSLPPAHYLEISREGSRLHGFWSLEGALHPQQTLSMSRKDAARHVRNLLEEAVQLHLISDAPLGVFLSGGMDSSALVALASRQSVRPLRTLSIDFEEAPFREGAYQRQMAVLYKTEHSEMRVGEIDFQASLPEFFRAMDQPTVDGLNTYFVSQAARRAGLTVVLSGIGSDELFLGYNHLRRSRQHERRWSWLERVPKGIRQAVLPTLARLGQKAGRLGMDRLEYANESRGASLYTTLRGLFPPSLICRLLGLGESQWQQVIQDPASHDLQTREFETYLGDQLLRDADVFGMAHSLEIRVPFLDHKLVEAVSQIPLSFKVNARQNKPLLAEAVADVVPASILSRPKQGFTFPFAPWMKNEAAALEEMALENTCLDLATVKEIWDDFRQDRCHWSRPWSTLVLARYSQAQAVGITPCAVEKRA